MHWREIINLMNELKVEEKVKLRLIGCMARALAGDRSTVKDAAILYEHYANDFEMAVNVLARNYFLEEAIHVATRHNQREIIAFEVLPMLHRQKTHFGEKLIELFDTYDQYRTRLAQVRQIKVDKFNRTYDDDDRDDLFSDAGSTITKSSRSSRRVTFVFVVHALHSVVAGLAVRQLRREIVEKKKRKNRICVRVGCTKT
jgi:hypothetical protein